jgi:hypothetical protein
MNAHGSDACRSPAQCRNRERAVGSRYHQGGSNVNKRGVIGIIVGMGLAAMLAVGCGTLTGAAVGAGSGAAIGAAAGDAKKGALIGAGVGAAGGAIYDATR